MASTSSGIGIADRMPQKEPSPDELASSALTGIKQKFIVMSGKGGVGKTSVSVNLSIALANKGFKVGLMDVDVHGPDIPRMLGLTGSLEIDGERKLIPKKFSENLCAVSVESLLGDKDGAVIWRGPMKHSAIRQFISEVTWGPLDCLIIDSPPGTGDEPLTIAQLIKDARAIIVTTPQEVALADVRKSINFCKTVGMEVFGLIENMSGFECPHCGEPIAFLGIGGGEKTAAHAGIPFLGRIPFDMHLVKCEDAGESYQNKFKFSAVTRAFDKVVAKITREIQQSNQMPKGENA
ncbi:MAG: Mrp/NBP35 family ATP-binding protein [Desulfobacterales bacterium]|jgi:Mrp family chromosome partitioning ATPase|nr:Mrp/NBP35 family ATP-binding protein [Desulfobacterales bacterium]